VFKKILLILGLLFIPTAFVFSWGILGCEIANLSWPISPLGTEITEMRNCLLFGDIICFKDNVTVPLILQYFYEWIIVLGGLAVFVAFIWAGLLLMTSVGDAGKMSQARTKMKNALLGLVLLMASYLIFYTINPDITNVGIIVEREPEITENVEAISEIVSQMTDFRANCDRCRAIDDMVARFIIPLPHLPDISLEMLGGINLPLIPPYESFLLDSAGSPKQASNCDELDALVNPPPYSDDFTTIVTNVCKQWECFSPLGLVPPGNCVKTWCDVPYPANNLLQPGEYEHFCKDYRCYEYYKLDDVFENIIFEGQTGGYQIDNYKDLIIQQNR